MVKKLIFGKLLYHRKCKQRGVGSQKKSNLVNVVCERTLTVTNTRSRGVTIGKTEVLPEYNRWSTS